MSKEKIIKSKNQSLGNFIFGSFKVRLLLSQRREVILVLVFLMDQVQKLCEIICNYIVANESKLSYGIHIERYVPFTFS